MREKRGIRGTREYTEYYVNRRRMVIVQRLRPALPWIIYDSVLGKTTHTVDHDMNRRRAEEKALVYIKGLKRAGVRGV